MDNRTGKIFRVKHDSEQYLDISTREGQHLRIANEEAHVVANMILTLLQAPAFDSVEYVVPPPARRQVQ